MYAIIASGGKQLRVEKDLLIKVEKLDAQIGDTVEFPALLVSGDGLTLIGAPEVEGAKVKAEVIAQGKARKVIVFKYKPKVNIRKKAGHRQPFTRLKVTEIVAPGAAEAADNAEQTADSAPQATENAAQAAENAPETTENAARTTEEQAGEN